MPYIADYKTQFTASADSLGFVIEPAPLSNVKAGDMLIMLWGANTDAEIELLDGFNLASHITANEAINSTNFQVGASNIFFQNGDILQIGEEKLLITGGAGDNTFNVQRGYAGTTAVAHSDNENIWKIDDADGLGGADWKPVPHGCSTMDNCEAKFYYKYATHDNEQVSSWTCPLGATNVYMYTAVVKGVPPTDPFLDAGTTYYTSNANTLVSYPDLIATAKDQLALYVGSSDGDTIVQGSHGTSVIYADTDTVMYQKISTSAGSMGAFTDTVASDQTTAIGVLFRDDPANTIIPLQKAPNNSLIKIEADNTNDSAWMEAIYASGLDPKTGSARVNVTPNLEVFSTTTQWVFRIDNGGTDWQNNGVIGETVTFNGANTGKLGWIRRYQTSAKGRAYMMVYDYNGSGESDNKTVIGSTSGASALIYGTGNYQKEVTGYCRSDIKLIDYGTYKISGCTGIGISDGVYFIKEHAVMNSENEGYWYQLVSHNETRTDGTVQAFTAGTASPTLSPYHMQNRTYTYVEGETNAMTRGTLNNESGWKTNYIGAFKSFATPMDYSNTGLAIWSKPFGSNTRMTFFVVIDDTNGWKLWVLSNKSANGYQYATPEYRVFDLNSVDTPVFQTASFDSSKIKFMGFLVQATTDVGRDCMYMYDQYTLGVQTIRGGGPDFGVPLSDIEKFLAVEQTLNGQNFTEGLTAYTPSMLVAAKTVRYSCYMESTNQAIGFPPQADGISNFTYNVDGDSDIFGLDFTDAKGSVASLLTSDRGNFLKTGGTSTLILEGSTIAKYNPTFQSGEVYKSVRFTGCGQITGGATFNDCKISGHTGTGGVLFDGAIIGGDFNNNTYAIEIPATGDYTLNDAKFSNNTADIAVVPSVIAGTINLTTNVSGVTIASDFTDAGGGVYTRGSLTLNLIAPSTTFSFTVNPSVTGYEWRIYQVTAMGSLAGAVELAGEESATADNQSIENSVTRFVAVQIIDLAHDYLESLTYYSLSNSSMDVIINLKKDTNN